MTAILIVMFLALALSVIALGVRIYDICKTIKHQQNQINRLVNRYIALTKKGH